MLYCLFIPYTVDCTLYIYMFYMTSCILVGYSMYYFCMMNHKSSIADTVCSVLRIIWYVVIVYTLDIVYGITS